MVSASPAPEKELEKEASVALQMEDLFAIWHRYVTLGEIAEGVRPVVREAWERCAAFGLDPKNLRAQEFDPALLAHAQERHRRLLTIADPYLQGVHDSFGARPHVVVLLEPGARVIRLLSDPVTGATGAASNLYEGASWAEQDIGCNGGGTSLAANKPVILIGPEHLLQDYTTWTCIGIPIHNPDGSIAGAIDLSVPNELVNLVTWGWMLHIARAIEEGLASEGPPPTEQEVARIVADLRNPFHVMRGTLDLLIEQLGVLPTHLQVIREARLAVDLAESQFRLTLREVGEMQQELQSANQGLLAANLRARERADEAEAARAQVTSILESITDGFCALDGRRQLTYVNGEAERLLRRERAELLGRDLLTVLPADLVETVSAELRRVMAGQTAYEYTVFSPSLERWLDVKAYPSGTGTALYFRDVTARRRAEEERERLNKEIAEKEATLVAEQRTAAERERLLRRIAELAETAQQRAGELQAVLDNMVDAVFVCDDQGQVTLANRAGLQLLEMESLEPEVRGVEEYASRIGFRYPDGAPVPRESIPLVRALSGEVTENATQQAYDPRQGREIYLRTNAAPIRDERGEIVGAVSVSRDVTELAELDQLKDQFIAVAAHELKTPVTIIRGFAQVLLRNPDALEAQPRRMLESILRGTDRIHRIVNDLLDVSRLEHGSLELAAETVDLTALVEQACGQVAASAKRRVRVVRAQPATVKGDGDRLEEVIVGLLQNAVKFSPDGGDVEVVVETSGEEATVSVADHGIGIPRHKQTRVFQRFYSAHTGTPHDFGGLAVGLFVSREVVTRHGGRMWFESEEGKGSVFHFSLPCWEDRR